MEIDKDDFFVKSQIQSNIGTIKKLMSSGVFSSPALRLFQEPSFMSVILKLNDLLQKFDNLQYRITFNNDMDNGDITDLVNKVRNAICHLDSPENLLDKKTQLKFVFNMIVGKGNAIAIGDNVIASSDYADDIAFYYGEHRIYLKRHIQRVMEEAVEVVKKLYPIV